MKPPAFGRRKTERAAVLSDLQVQAAPARPQVSQNLPGMADIDLMTRSAALLGIADPFFRVHEGRAGATTRIDGREYINFASYDYLGLNGRAEITERVMQAMARYGTSVSASRVVSGERPIHHELEAALADLHGTEDCVAMVSGHATNVTTLAQLMRPGDLILHDSLAHNSLIQGAILSGARRIAFTHNSVDAAREQLWMHRRAYKRAIIVLEGHYSMDGDLPDLAAFVALAREFDCLTMVDEAHSVGVLGRTGRGIAEYADIAPDSVDIWMGTLSKSLVSCGGYIAGRADIVRSLKHMAAGFVYSVGISPPAAAATLGALALMQQEPWRLTRLAQNSSLLLRLLNKAGFNTGTSGGHGIIPVITGSSLMAARLAQSAFEAGVNVLPIIHPAVPEQTARLRFFVSAAHTDAQLEETVEILKSCRARLDA